MTSRISIPRDHPRMCGKDPFVVCDEHAQQGSPPHVRERLPSVLRHHRRNRITPACAGKTTLSYNPDASLGDHPRMCGKDFTGLSSSITTRGSPPHVRERPLVFHPQIYYSRITPACAGKTLLLSFFPLPS